MSLFLDVLTVLVFIFVIYNAYKKGFLRAAIDLVGFIAAFAVSFALSAPLGKWFDSAFLGKYVHGSIEQLTASKGSASQTDLLKQFAGKLPGSLTNSLEHINSGLGNIGAKAAESIINAITLPLASVLSRGLAFFILLALCLVAVSFVARLSDAVIHIPVLGTIISTLLALLISVMALAKDPPITFSQVNATHIYKYVYDLNPLTGILLKK
jgi:small-conductance mechanosensitive channel